MVRMSNEQSTLANMTQTNATDNDNAEESTEEYEIPMPGMLARDRDKEEHKRVVIIARTGLVASDDEVSVAKTVAEFNPEHPDDAPTVLCVYLSNLEERWPDKWAEWPASMLTYMVGKARMRTYSFPVTRLKFGPEFVEDEVAKAEAEGEALPEPDAGVSCTACEWHTDPETVEAVYALHNEACPVCNAPVREVLEDGGGNLNERVRQLEARVDHLEDELVAWQEIVDELTDDILPTLEEIDNTTTHLVEVQQALADMEGGE